MRSQSPPSRGPREFSTPAVSNAELTFVTSFPPLGDEAPHTFTLFINRHNGDDTSQDVSRKTAVYQKQVVVRFRKKKKYCAPQRGIQAPWILFYYGSICLPFYYSLSVNFSSACCCRISCKNSPPTLPLWVDLFSPLTKRETKRRHLCRMLFLRGQNRNRVFVGPRWSRSTRGVSTAHGAPWQGERENGRVDGRTRDTEDPTTTGWADALAPLTRDTPLCWLSHTFSTELQGLRIHIHTHNNFFFGGGVFFWV